MARKDDYIPTRIRNAVALDSNRRCQYRNCSKEVILVDSGRVTTLGEYAHILPAGDVGPRAKYRAHYPHIKLESFENIILLCPEHHNLIDNLEVDRHTPEILFRMKAEKSVLLQDSIAGELQRQSAIEIELEDYIQQYQLSEVLDQFSKARSSGPRKGGELFKAAESTMRSLVKNAFFAKGQVGEILLAIEHRFTRLYLTYKRKAWVEAYEQAQRVLRLDLPEAVHFHLLSCSLTLVRDEYGVFQPNEKIALISQLVSFIDTKIDLAEPRRSAFLLVTKSALLRWRGRFERGPNQRNTYAGALRCCEKGHELSGNPGALLQSALISYSNALAYQLHEAPKHEPYLSRCFEILESPELVDFGAAIKYRPRLYRETYKFKESIQAFWFGVARYPAEFKRVAYVLGEAAAGEYNHHDQGGRQALSDAKDFLESAIGEGYHHGRNVISYIGCRGILEPDWFRAELLDRVLEKEDSDIKWEDLVARIRNVLYDPHDKYDEPSFGIDGGEFWSTLGSVTGRVLLDHAKAIRLYRIAEIHSEVSGGKLRANLGLALQHKAIGDIEAYKRYVRNMRTFARAPQKVIFEQLEAG